MLGHDVVRDAAQVRSLLGVTGQQASVDDVLTGRENLVLTGRLLGLGRAGARRRADELLERFDLTGSAGRRVGTWSGGMRRRLDLAASLVTTPRVLVLDEPTTGLDARSRAVLWDEVRAIAAGGHRRSPDDPVPRGGGRARRPRRRHRRGAGRGRRLARTHCGRRVGGEVVQVHDPDGRVERVLPTDGSAADVGRVIGGLPRSARVTVRRPTMDEVFLHLTGDGPGSAGTATGLARRRTEQVSA